MLDDLFMRILDMTKTGSIVILVVLAARLLLKRAPKVFSYALWAAVLFRLLCPVSFGETPVSLVPEIVPVADTYSLKDESISVLEAGTAAYQAVGDALNGGLGVQHLRTTQMEPDGTYRVVTTDWYSVWILFGQYVWLAGAVWMLLHSMISYRKLRRKTEIAFPLRDNLYLADGLESPFVVGLIRPKIYLPADLSQREYDYIILHEQHHIRRGDHIIKALAFLALCLHWFNPLVWLAFHLASKDMEMSCDEAVVRKMGEGIRADYAASLLTLATGRRIIAGTPLAFGEGDPQGRIRNLAKWKKPALWVTIIAVVLCAVLGICLLTDPAPAQSSDGVSWYYGTVVDHATRAVKEGDAQARPYITLQCDDGKDRLFWMGRNCEDPGDILGKYVVVRGKIEADTGLQIFTSVQVTDPAVFESLDEAIHQAILDQNYSALYDGLCQTAHFKQLSSSEDGIISESGSKGIDVITVYGIAYHQVYRLENDILVEDSGSCIPTVLTFGVNDSGKLILTEYWQPRDGTYYPIDIQAKFRGRPYPDTQRYIMEQTLNTYAQAMDYYGIGTDVVINTILDDICVREQWNDSFDALMENCPQQRAMLAAYGTDTLKYCFAEFIRGGQVDLRGKVMVYVCREIMEDMGEVLLIDPEPENGQVWFDAFAGNAERLMEQYEPDEIQTRYPASWLYLKMTGQLPSQQISSAASANGFEIKLYADRDYYHQSDAIHLWATLEYQGEGDTVTIWHGRPYITFSISDGADFNTGGMVATILTSTQLRKGEVYRFEYRKSGGYDPAAPDGEYWENFYQEEGLHLPPGTYTVTVNGAFSVSQEQRPGEQGPSCELEITVTQ